MAKTTKKGRPSTKSRVSPDEVILHVPKDPAMRTATLAEFSKRLQAAMLEKGWSQSDLARNAALHMWDKSFGRDSVSRYKLGKHAPTPLHLMALAKALGKKPEDLLPGYTPDMAIPPQYDFAKDARPFSMEAREEGDVWLRINTNVPMETAMKILQLISEAKPKEAGDAP